MNWCTGECADNLFQPLQNQWSDVEVRWLPRTHVHLQTHVGVFYANIVAYGGCAQEHS
ncbi:hypothetical protein D3C78_1751440 [compost metagenome]